MFEKTQFDTKIAKVIGDRKAQILEFILWSIEDKEAKAKEDPKAFAYLIKDGRYYMWDTHDAWQERFPWLGQSTIRRFLKELKNDGWIYAERMSPNKQNSTVYYSLNKDKYDSVRGAQNEQAQFGGAQNEQAGCSKRATLGVLKMSNSSSPNTLTNTPTKTPPSTKQNKLSVAKASDKPRVKKYTDDDLVLAEKWLEYSLFEMPWKKEPASWTRHGFAEAIAKIKRVVDINQEGIEALLKFVRNDQFWAKNALSPSSMLNKSKNGNRKIDNILLAMRPQEDRQIAKIRKEGSPSKDVRDMTDAEKDKLMWGF